MTGSAGAAPGPKLTVTPAEGAIGETIFVLTGTGFTPRTVYSIRIQSENRQNTLKNSNPDITADGNGVLLDVFGSATLSRAGRISSKS